MNTSIILLSGWFMVMQSGYASWISPNAYASFADCKRAAMITQYNYDQSSSSERMFFFAWNCVPDQWELSNGNVK